LWTKKTWYQTGQDLEIMFERWGVTDYQVIGRPSQKTRQSQEERSVSIRFYHPAGREIVVTKHDQARSVDNLRALYLGLDDMRMMERRGVVDVIRDALLQLPAPPKYRDPYEILGVRSDSPVEVIDAAYRAQAKRLHPDVGGDEAAMGELNEAYERIKRGEA
jgi:hypothetical protein